jgi:hypothetical protein
MGQAVKIQLGTSEGQRLFNIANRLDRILRVFKANTLHRKFKRARLQRILIDTEDTVTAYRTFLNQAYSHFRPFSAEAQLAPSRNVKYKGITKTLALSGTQLTAIVSNSVLVPLFEDIKTTNICILIAEEYGLKHYENYVSFINNFNAQINILESFQHELYQTAHSLQFVRSKEGP